MGPNEQQIAEAKAIALAASGSDVVELITLDDPELAFLVRPMLPKEWADHVDAVVRHAGDAQGAAYVTHVLWPKPNEASALATRYPDLPRLVTVQLAEIAGNMPKSKPRIEPLTAETSPMVLEAIGLSSETAKDLLARYAGPGQLSIVRLQRPEIALVVKRLPKPIFDAMNDRLAEAREVEKGIDAAVRQGVLESVVWSPEPAERLFARYPALVTGALFGVVRRLGGAGARAERKRL